MDKISKNARIVVELARLYPDDSLSAIIGVLDMPVIDKNNAIWYAMGTGMIEETKDTTKPIVLKTKATLELVDEVEEVKQAILYCLYELAKDEGDISEDSLNSWLTGYKTHFSAIALKQLLEAKVIATYTLMDQVYKKKGVEEYPYRFYTLNENLDKEWGRKQFRDQEKVRTKSVDDDGITRH